MPRRKAQTRDATVYLPIDLFEAVDRASAAENMPRSHYIERALNYYLNSCKP